MTTNQLRWAELQEAKRHNVVSEGIGSATLSETARHNVEWERQNWYSAQAQANYQRMQGQASMSQAGAAWQNAITRQGELAESSRHNKKFEDIQQLSAESNWKNALTRGLEYTLESNKWMSGGLAESWARAGLWNTQARTLPVQTGINAIGALSGAGKLFTNLNQEVNYG